MVDILATGRPQVQDCQIGGPAWARPYLKLVIIAFALNVISAALFIGLVNRPVYDDKFNFRDFEIYAHNGLSVASVLSHRNPPGPTSFLWMAAGVRLFGGGELRDARIANLISWVLLFVGILVGARYGSFPQIWYAALLAALVFPHTVMTAATTLTEGPALFFAMLGALIWIDSASRPTVTACSFSLQTLAGFSMGIAVSCRQYYLALFPAAALFALLQLRRKETKQKYLRLVGTILSLLVASVPVRFKSRKNRLAKQPPLRRAHGAPLLKTLAAKDRASLRWAKRDGGFLPALRTTSLGFRAHRAAVSAAARRVGALGLASLAALGLVLKALIREKHLFAGRKYKLGAALRALQNLVMVFHGSVPPETPIGGNAQNFARKAGTHRKTCTPKDRAGLLGACERVSATLNFRSLPDRGLNHGAGRRALDELESKD
jgi:hypothetical protein